MRLVSKDEYDAACTERDCAREAARLLYKECNIPLHLDMTLGRLYPWLKERATAPPDTPSAPEDFDRMDTLQSFRNVFYRFMDEHQNCFSYLDEEMRYLKDRVKRLEKIVNEL